MRTALVTGATDGVGRVVALRLAVDGFRVIAHGRNAERGRSLVAEMRAAGNAHGLFLAADLASLAEVEGLAAAVLGATDRLDLLVNNAGIGPGPAGAPRETSRDGHELRFAVNYLAGYLLTRRLLPLLGASAPARIVNVSSLGQEAIDFGDVMLARGYDGGRAYRQSKLAQILFTFDLAEELAGTGVTAACLHPATLMPTTMVREMGRATMSTIDEGADAILALALGQPGGLYFNGRRETRADPQAYDPAARARLRRLSDELTEGGARWV